MSYTGTSASGVNRTKGASLAEQHTGGRSRRGARIIVAMLVAIAATLVTLAPANAAPGPPTPGPTPAPPPGPG
ncbi:MAG: hypothetical protein ACC652_06875, partial [Acidimicrobiales bacterium]